MTSTLYYISRADDSSDGLFGTADQCAHWYLTYDGGDYRVSPKVEDQYDDDDQLVAEKVQVDEGYGPVWTVEIRDRANFPFRDVFHVTAPDVEQALADVRQDMVNNVLLARRGGDSRFSMIPGEMALPYFIQPDEMRRFYEDANQPATDDQDEVVDWFFNTRHSNAALLKMLALVAQRERSPITPGEAEILKTQIEAQNDEQRP